MRRRCGVLAACLLLSGCGVPIEREPRTLNPSVTIGSPEAPTAQASAGAAVEKLYLVRDNQLVAVERRPAAPPDLDRQLTDLMSGPTEVERDNGLGSALAGTDLIAGVQLEDGTAVVGVGDNNPIRNDEVLAYGQIVCTLAARDDVDAVQFVQNGRPLEVPRADGSLTPDPLTAADYHALIAVR
jgi:spore germination protein GerM